MADKKPDFVWKNSHFNEGKSTNSTSKNTGKKQPKGHTFNLKSNRRRSNFKPIMIASFSALTIGAILGFLLLGTFIHFPNKQDSAQMTHLDSQSENNTNDNSTIKKNIYTLPDLHGHVLQGGMFGQEKNAEEWQMIFEEAEIPTYIWKEQGSFYLFAGLFSNEDRAKEVALKNKEAGLDIFTKGWITNEQDVELTKKENEWILSMVTLWETSLQSLTEGDNFQINDWDNLVVEKPSNMPHIQALVELIEQTLDQGLLDANENEKQMMLLAIWHEYKNL